MKLSLREKRNFYHELGRLVRAGKVFANALELMLENTRGNLRRFLRALHAAALRGESVAEAFARQPAIGQMEREIIAASERAGRLEQACAQLASYFGALDQARATVLRRSLYPLFMLHFGVFVTAAPKLAMGGTRAAYAAQTLGFLGVLYVVGIVLYFILQMLAGAGETSAPVDAALRAVPLVGKLRRSFALARFCATYEAQLSAGVNVLDTLAGAAAASRSALIAHGVRRGLPEVRAGGQVGTLLQEARVFPAALVRAFRMGEATGELDAELNQLTQEYEREALTRVETLSDWLPKIVYLLIAVYLGWQIIGVYQNMAGSYEKMLDL